MTVGINRKAAAAVSRVHAGVCVRPTEDLFQPPELECVLLSWRSRSNKPNIRRLWRLSSQLGSTLSPLLAAAYTTHHKMLRSHSFSLPFLMTWALAAQLFLSFRLSHVSSVRPSFSEKCQIDIAATRLLIFTNVAAKSVGDSP